ncbi:hypothetical protein [Formosa haliotis]|uniref:hypothetical protein n=1 Tax=Formosa haliotis TaxID=1555194 RepID=UPI0013563E61|nr:hypothetical protein [Formosa haliotis]
MKKLLLVLFFGCALLGFLACDSDADICSGVFVDGECVPDYVFPPNNAIHEDVK